MQLIADLEARRAGEGSAFRQVLLGEDIARLGTLAGILARSATRADFLRDGLMIGWTPGDTRTFELKPAIEALLCAIWDAERAGGDAAAVGRAWAALEQLRLDRLVGCLARVPRPE